MTRMLILLAAAALTAGCAAASPPPPSTTLRDVEAIDGDGYHVTTGCYGTTRVFLRASAVAVAANDVTCMKDVIR